MPIKCDFLVRFSGTDLVIIHITSYLEDKESFSKTVVPMLFYRVMPVGAVGCGLSVGEH